MKLIVGLGNPEKKYENTRHNVGFDVLDVLAKKLDTEFRQNTKKAIVAPAFYEGEKILLAKPQTYMNLSGESVGPLSDYYNIPVEDILIVVDDVNLDLGRLRLRAGGSAGGHNGLKNIILNLATEDFARLRVGVGAPDGNLIAHVLGKVSKDEKEILKEIEKVAADAALEFCVSGIESAMNKYNSFGKEGGDGEV